MPPPVDSQLEGLEGNGSSFRAEHLNPPVLSEMLVEREGSRDVTSVENGERNRVAQRPVFVGVSSQDLLGPLFLSRKNPHDRQTACQQPLTGNRPPELPHEQCVGLGLDISGDEAGTLFGRDVASHCDRSRMVGVVCVKQGQDGA